MATTTIDWAAVRQRVELCATTLATRCIALGFQPVAAFSIGRGLIARRKLAARVLSSLPSGTA